MSEWSLRLARPEDAELMPRIETAAAALFLKDETIEGIDSGETRQPEEFARLIAKGHCLVVHTDDEMVGFLASEPFKRELHIWEMDVLPKYQGKGIGAGLVRACQIDARNTGFRAVTLTTFRDVPWNGPFYTRLGFVEVDDLAAHPRLAAELEEEAAAGLQRERRCAMICFLD